METLQDRLQREAREIVKAIGYSNITEGVVKAIGYSNITEGVVKAIGYSNITEGVVNSLISHTISETIKAGVSVIEGEKKEDYCYDEKNEAHNDFEESLDYLETKGEAHKEGYSTGLQTAVTKLQELGKTNGL